MTRRAFPIACAVALLLMTRGPVAAAKQPAGAKGPAFVDITWMSITNMLYELGTFGVLTDGYISRIPQSAFFGGGGGLAQTQAALRVRCRGRQESADRARRPVAHRAPADRTQSFRSFVRHRDLVEADQRTHHRVENHLPAGAGGGSAADPMPRRVRRRAHRHHRRRLDACDPVEPQRRFDDQSGAAQSRRARRSAADRSGHGRSARRASPKRFPMGVAIARTCS